MLKLSAPSAEPFWLNVAPGIRVQFRPITVVAMLVAREAVGKLFQAEAEDESTAADRTVRAGILLTRELSRQGIVAWEGVGDESSEAAPVNDENVGRLLDVWPIYREIDERYVGPALAVAAEKNDSGNSPSGTSETTGDRTAALAR